MFHADSQLPRFTLRQLEAFVTVARLGGVSPAAARLARTQSAISMSVQDLETALGAELFARSGRSLTMTDAGARLLPRAIEMIDRAGDICNLVSTDQETPSPVALGASRTVGPALMPALLSKARQSLPSLAVSLTVGNSERLLASILAFDLDCAFVEGDVTDSTLLTEPWLNDRLCLVARADHPIHRSKGALSRRLAGLQWVLRERGSGSREIFMRAFEPEFGAPHLAIEVDEPETQKQLVRDSDLITCLSARAFKDDNSLREIDGVSSALKRALTRRFWIVRHPQRFRRDAVERLVQAAKSLHS